MIFPIDHDLHAHSGLSACSADPDQTPAEMLRRAKANGYTLMAVTDHMWDNLVPDPSDWYRPQDVEHISQALPLPQDDEVKMLFGCETEYCGGKKLGLHPSHYDLFDMIVIPPNHFHMKNFTRPACYDTEEKVADLLTERLEELLLIDLPWKKVGIAHLVSGLTFTEGDENLVYELVDEKRFRAAMRSFAKKGAGIELNLASFPPTWKEHEHAKLRMFRMAKEEGCRFYLASDAHHPNDLTRVPTRAQSVVDALGLTGEDLFRPEKV